MRAISVVAALIMTLAGSAMGQYKMVNGKVYAKNSRDWRVFYERIEVQFGGPIPICRTFTMQGSDGKIGAGVRTAGHSETKVYGETFALKNYPGAAGFRPGDEIHGPIAAMPTGAEYRNVQIYDYGTDYTPPPPKGGTTPVSKTTATGAGTADTKKLDPGAVTTFKFHLQKARDGDVGSQVRVAQLYLEGKGTQQDTNQAKIWLEKAKAQGSEEASGMLKDLE